MDDAGENQMSSKITRSARGEQCQVRLIGICNGNPETVVWAHANGSAAGKGIGMKAPDYLGAYCCSNCHDVYDRRVPYDGSRTAVELCFAEGVWRSQRMLEAKKLLVVA